MKKVLFAGLSRLAVQPWFRLRRGLTLGVRGVVRDDRGGVLLIRHSYLPGWSFPGGGVERGETVEEALARELVEEAAIELTARPLLYGIYSNHEQFAGDHIALFVVSSFEQRRWRPTSEVVEAGFFAPGELPPDTTGGTRRRLAEIIDGRERASVW